MTAALQDVFADTAFWIALVVKQDQYHDRVQKWSIRIAGRITTTAAVLLETANALARPVGVRPGLLFWTMSSKARTWRSSPY
jgi:predicted nucleic acid-binding protein